ncbi:hypothetical protein [Ralstonia sp. A12]|uniref:hypothetical protein n=1 Tax=Ralstonia sp. A12 TaxID=1217052 RepID=UPI00057CCCF9|nr:hypothetical protein [Ralstonia sp. A12]
MGDLDSRVELAHARLAAFQSRVSASAGAQVSDGIASAAPSDEAADLRRELEGLSNAGNHRVAMFPYAETLDSGILGERDPQLGKAWVMAAMQPSGGFDERLVESYSGYAAAVGPERARMLSTAKEINGRCCQRMLERFVGCREAAMQACQMDMPRCRGAYKLFFPTALERHSITCRAMRLTYPARWISIESTVRGA